MGSDLSEASFRHYVDVSGSESDIYRNTTDLTSLEPPHRPLSRPRSERRLGPSALADYSDNPDDDTDKDI